MRFGPGKETVRSSRGASPRPAPDAPPAELPAELPEVRRPELEGGALPKKDLIGPGTERSVRGKNGSATDMMAYVLTLRGKRFFAPALPGAARKPCSLRPPGSAAESVARRSDLRSAPARSRRSSPRARRRRPVPHPLALRSASAHRASQELRRAWTASCSARPSGAQRRGEQPRGCAGLQMTTVLDWP